ncbi:hypothetical protein MSPP1_003908 [Malassezia sp. CBS 17886]|nr:hypothetical protein MSPP1_003908 [Malassezia sp. CBS 17886]
MHYDRSRMRTRSTGKLPITACPEEDQSSWIADDICTRCGGLAPHGKLYCSEACRADDSSACATNSTPENIEAAALAESLSKLRYPMTVSPSNASTLPPSSRSLPARQRHSALFFARCDSVSSLSSVEDLKDATAAHRTHMRTGSRSSTTSSEALDSEQRTPSPWHTGLELDDDAELSKLDDADLKLPPALCASNHILPRKGPPGPVCASKTVSFTTPRRAPALSPALVPQSPVARSSKGISGMQFHRQPGATNLPMPVMFTAPVAGQGGIIRTSTIEEGAEVARTDAADSADLPVHPRGPTKSEPCLAGHQVRKRRDAANGTSTLAAQRNTPKVTDTLREAQVPQLARALSDGAKGPPSVSCLQCYGSACGAEVMEDMPVRGRALQRTQHSCCSRKRRLELAACGEFTIPTPTGFGTSLSVSPQQDLRFPTHCGPTFGPGELGR